MFNKQSKNIENVSNVDVKKKNKVRKRILTTLPI